MAFFKKLKDRLFKSSSKLDAGLEAIVDEAPDPVEEAQVGLSVNDLQPHNPNSLKRFLVKPCQTQYRRQLPHLPGRLNQSYQWSWSQLEIRQMKIPQLKN
jgi:hypothetical protein